MQFFDVRIQVRRVSRGTNGGSHILFSRVQTQFASERATIVNGLDKFQLPDQIVFEVSDLATGSHAESKSYMCEYSLMCRLFKFF